MIVKAQKYRIYPNAEQREFLMKSFGCVRFVYNWALAYKNKEYEETKKSSSAYSLIKKLPELKIEYPWLKEVYSQSLQSSLLNLDNAFTAFYRKNAMHPKFKSKNHNDFSCSFPQNVYIEDGKLRIPKIKDPVKIKLHRPMRGKIKGTTISKTPSDQFYASFVIEVEGELPELPEIHHETTIGIDLGVKDFAILSNGEKIENPKYLKKSLVKLKNEQRKLSKMKKGGQNRKKQRLKVARVHQKVSNQRKDFLHKTTHALTHKNQVETYCIEDLKVKNMVQNHKLAQAISDVGWGEFRRQLEYKCAWYGKNLIIIPTFAPSSKMCSKCGKINETLTLADRIWACECGVTHDRDLNAAINIKNFGLQKALRTAGTAGVAY